MTLLLNTSIKVTLIVLVALVATAVLRRRSAAVRHFVLAAALACATATPALRLVAPAWQAGMGAWLTESRVQLIDRPLLVLDSTTESPASVPRAQSLSVSRAATVARWLGIVWAAGAGASLFVLLAGLSRLAWLASRAERVTGGPWARIAAEVSREAGLRRPPVLLRSRDAPLLATWGFFRAKVMLPSDVSDWPEDRIRIVLAHELAHVRRGDWLVQMAAEVVRSLYWFNPLVWVACRRLRLESEQACDDAVLKTGVEGSTYATELVDLARAFKSQQEMFLPAAAIARSSSLERRVRAMLNVRLNREPITRRASIAAAALFVAVAVLVAGFGVSAQSFSTVSGSLVDQFTRALPGVTLALSNPQNQSKYEIKSDATGHYEFVGVPPGNYVLTAEHMGFATVKREGVVLAGQAFQQNITMQVGTIEETITIVDDGVQRPPQVNSLRDGPRVSPGRLASCGDTPLGGNIRPPTKTRDVRPVYPTGTPGARVELDARIGVDGRVTSVQPVGNPNPDLANAAINAVSGWEFTPTYLDCQPIEVRMKVHMNFVAAK
jgi:beta-lactamase regulating signal transducer with metallopeptidase domain